VLYGMRPAEPAGLVISSKIVDFHLDDGDEWVAELDCGHEQRVRHNPPLMVNPWITSPQGRLEHLGRELTSITCSGSLFSAVQRDEQ
jgi:hypothetical protein